MKQSMAQGHSVLEIAKPGSNEKLRIVDLQFPVDDKTKQTIVNIGNLVKADETTDDIFTKTTLTKILKACWTAKSKNSALIIKAPASSRSLTESLRTFVTAKKPTSPALSDSADLT